MNTFDDIFDSAKKNSQENRPFDKDAWAERKQAERKSVYDLADQTAEMVSTDGGRFREYLDIQTRFDRYSATNIQATGLSHHSRKSLLKSHQ